MQARTGKFVGVVAASAAIALSGVLTGHTGGTFTAHADDPTPTTTPTVPIPTPQGPGCDASVKAVTSGPGSLESLVHESSSTALASIPQLSTFSHAISGQLNPDVNVASVLDNGPYIVFAPTDEAFAKLPPEQLEALKSDPAALTALVYYHMVLGILGPDDVHGTMPTQQGNVIAVKGKGGDITVNDAKVVCGGIKAEHMRIYMIDTVLSPNEAPETITPAPTTTSSATETTTATAAPEATAASTEPTS